MKVGHELLYPTATDVQPVLLTSLLHKIQTDHNENNKDSLLELSFQAIAFVHGTEHDDTRGTYHSLSSQSVHHCTSPWKEWANSSYPQASDKEREKRIADDP